MTGPTIRGVYAGNPAPAAGSGNRTVTASWTSGDKIIILGSTEDSSITLATPSATGLGSVTAKGTGAAANSCWVGAWEGIATSTQASVTVTSVISGSTSNQGWILVIVVDPATAGTPVYTIPTAAVSPLTSITRGGTDSNVFEIAGDWGATAVRAASPSTNSTVVVGTVVSGKYTAYGLRWTTQGAPGTTSYGLAGSNFSDAFARAIVEIPGTTSGTSATVTPAVVAASASIGTAALSTGSRIAPPVVAAATAVNAAVVTAGTRVSPGVVSAAATINSPAVAAGASVTVAPAVVPVAASIGAPTVGGGGTVYHAAADPSGSQFAASPFNDPQPINIGFVFNATAPATIGSVRYYKIGHGNDGQTITGSLYAVGAGGTPVAQATRVQQVGDPDGWISIPITPYAITPGQDYTAAVHLPLGWYVGGDLQDSISGQPYQGPLQSIAGASKYVYGSLAEPTGSGISYFLAVDVEAQGTSSPNATVTPPVVGAAASIAAPTISAGAGVSPPVVAAAAGVPTPTVVAARSATATPVVVAASAAVPSPAVQAGAKATPPAVGAAASIPAPTVTTATGVLVTPAFVPATVTIPPLMGSVSTTVTPPVVNAGTTVYAATVGTQVSSTVSPGVVAGSAAIPSPAIRTGATAAPSTVAASAVVPAPSVTAGGSATASPPVVTAVVVIPGPSLRAGATVLVSTVSVTSMVPAPTVTGATSELITPVSVSGAVTVPAVTVTGSVSATASPAALTAVAVIPAPVVRVPIPVLITPATVMTEISIPTPVVTIGPRAKATTRLAAQRLGAGLGPQKTTTSLGSQR